VGGHLAFPQPPFGCGIGINEAKLAGGKFAYSLASLTLFHDGMTRATIELAALFCHEKALMTLFNNCTNHGYHILSLDLRPFWRDQIKGGALGLRP